MDPIIPPGTDFVSVLITVGVLADRVKKLSDSVDILSASISHSVSRRDFRFAISIIFFVQIAIFSAIISLHS